eukprot:6488223-Amphidinium_carterae.3
MAARLKLDGVLDGEIGSLVDDMIESLGLTECMNTLCGARGSVANKVYSPTTAWLYPVNGPCNKKVALQGFHM